MFKENKSILCIYQTLGNAVKDNYFYKALLGRLYIRLLKSGKIPFRCIAVRLMSGLWESFFINYFVAETILSD